MTNSEKDQLLAILSMDSYNQGYKSKFTHEKTQIGAAVAIETPEFIDQSEWEAAGFYAVSYNTSYGKVISYRGTNEDSTQSSELFLNILKDVWNGWTIEAVIGKRIKPVLQNSFFKILTSQLTRTALAQI